ncbi:MAG: hypothetical protein Q8P84_09020 [Deltaproteobacteria bacterium]|nr:hypothetical protein [Deltaproteobacteria bacterium]
MNPLQILQSAFLAGPSGVLQALNQGEIQPQADILFFDTSQTLLGPLSDELERCDVYTEDLKEAHGHFLQSIGCRSPSGSNMWNRFFGVALALAHVPQAPYFEAVGQALALPSARILRFPAMETGKTLSMETKKQISPHEMCERYEKLRVTIRARNHGAISFAELVLRVLSRGDVKLLWKVFDRAPMQTLQLLIRLAPFDNEGAGFYLFLLASHRSDPIHPSLVLPLIHVAQKSPWVAEALMELVQIKPDIFHQIHLPAMDRAAREDKTIERALEMLLAREKRLVRPLYYRIG